VLLSSHQNHRAVGVLVGQAAGDALGVPYQFGVRALTGEPQMLGGGLACVPPGSDLAPLPGVAPQDHVESGLIDQDDANVDLAGQVVDAASAVRELRADGGGRPRRDGDRLEPEGRARPGARHAARVVPQAVLGRGARAPGHRAVTASAAGGVSSARRATGTPADRSSGGDTTAQLDLEVRLTSGLQFGRG
jgi:hypothetical protein